MNSKCFQIKIIDNAYELKAMIEEVGARKCVLLIVTVGQPAKQAAWEFVSTAGNEVGHEDTAVADT